MAFHWEEGIEYARFIDEDRQNIEVMHIIDNPENVHGREAKLHVLPVDENDDQFKALMEHFTHDDIMEMTYSYNQNAERAFEEQVMAIAQKQGMLNMAAVEVVSEAFVQRFVDVMFGDEQMSEQEEKELLFKTKLQLFELDRVKESNNRDLKAKLRKADSLKEIILAMINLDEDIDQRN
jgi:hypothetical protein